MAFSSGNAGAVSLGAEDIPVTHPFAPLTSHEITRAGEILKASWHPKTDFRFKVITLEEPAKGQMVPYLDALQHGKETKAVPRKAFISYYIRNTDRFHEAVVNLSAGIVESNVRLGPNVHGNADTDELLKVEKTALFHPDVKAAIAKLQLPKDAVVCADPWIYGSDGIDDDDRQFQVFLYMRDPHNPRELDSNHYAFPLPISPVVETVNFQLVRIDYLPTGADNTVREPRPWQYAPPSEYIPEHNQPLRKGLKPLHVTQPDGPSFQIEPIGETGHRVQWQTWDFIIGFNQREGMVLYDIRYDGRPLFYRVALSDMAIPYADPRHPFHKKQAFDLGDGGAGAMANNLKLGCDCLGHIQYLHGMISNDTGGVTQIENAVCVHEQDAGILWKHTNYRTGRAALVRSRELVFQSILTAGNYEYILAFVFNQAAELTYEVRATGILSTQPIDQELNDIGTEFGTVVHPGVLAAHHQHIFSLRVDPMLDGHKHSVVYNEAFPMPIDSKNPSGHGYFAKDTIIDQAGGYDLDLNTNRTFKVLNYNVRNPVNKKPVGYKIIAPPFQKILAAPTSFHAKRAEFADHHLYVTSYRDHELYAGGWYTNQSRGGTGVKSFASRNDNVKDADIVLWVSFGMNHIPRIEDFPVMPAEIIKVTLKPVNFFSKNPALDVAPSEQNFNKSTQHGSVEAAERHRQPLTELKVAEACCSDPPKTQS